MAQKDNEKAEVPEALGRERVRTLLDANSGRMSENVRTLSFAAVALIWVIADQKLDRFTQPLRIAAGAVTFALAFDFLQYFWNWGALKVLLWQKKLTRDGSLLFPKYVRRIANLFVLLKVLSLMTAFGCIIVALSAYSPDPPKPPPADWPCIFWPQTHP